MKNDNYPTKVYAVKLLESGRSVNSICKELHVGPNSLRLWYEIYRSGGDLALLRKAHESHYSPEEKRKIVMEILNNQLTLSSASSKHMVPSNTIRRWVKAYLSKGPEGLERKNAAKTMAKKKAYKEEQLDELEMLRRRNEYLEAENALLKKVKALVEEREARLRATGRKPSRD